MTGFTAVAGTTSAVAIAAGGSESAAHAVSIAALTSTDIRSRSGAISPSQTNLDFASPPTLYLTCSPRRVAPSAPAVSAETARARALRPVAAASAPCSTPSRSACSSRSNPPCRRSPARRTRQARWRRSHRSPSRLDAVRAEVVQRFFVIGHPFRAPGDGARPIRNSATTLAQ